MNNIHNTAIIEEGAQLGDNITNVLFSNMEKFDASQLLKSY